MLDLIQEMVFRNNNALFNQNQQLEILIEIMINENNAYFYYFFVFKISIKYIVYIYFKIINKLLNHFKLKFDILIMNLNLQILLEEIIHFIIFKELLLFLYEKYN